MRYGASGALLEFAVMHGGEEEAERLREELRKLEETVRRTMAAAGRNMARTQTKNRKEDV